MFLKIMMKYYYVYVLYSAIDSNFYTGYTNDLKKRIREHDLGKVKSTRERRPLKLVYFEGCLDQDDAIKREKYLKTTYGKRYLKNRISSYINKYSTG